MDEIAALFAKAGYANYGQEVDLTYPFICGHCGCSVQDPLGYCPNCNINLQNSQFDRGYPKNNT